MLDLKCFDQVSRKFLTAALRAGGCPEKLITAYSAFHEHLVYHIALAGTLGQAHKHPLGIPQGCPLSMTFIAFLLVPWVRAIRHAGCIPRSLADDITCTATGPQHESLLIKGYSITLHYMSSMGARLAPLKCV